MQVVPSSDSTPWMQLVVVTTLSSSAGARHDTPSAANSVPAGQVVCSCASEYLVIANIAVHTNTTTNTTAEMARIFIMNANASSERAASKVGPVTQADNPMAAVAAELRRLNEAVITRRLDHDDAAALAVRVGELTRSVEAHPKRSKVDNFGMRNRITSFLETGAWPDPPPDGSQIEFDVASAIGGELSPVSVGATYFRDGDEVVGRVSVGHCFEGPPERVHGGIVCAIFDEVMGSVFRATGTASAFTGELAVRFEAPAPIGVELEFRSRLVGESGRKRFLEGEATGPDGRFATATATFIEMRTEHFT